MKNDAENRLTAYKALNRGMFGRLLSRPLALSIIAAMPFGNAGLAFAEEVSDAASAQDSEAVSMTSESNTSSEYALAGEGSGQDVTIHFGEGEERAITIHVNPVDPVNPSEAEETPSDAYLEETEPETEPEEAKKEYSYEDNKVRVTATLEKPGAVPADAEFRVIEITPDISGYNYDAYLQALNEKEEGGFSYDSSNTVLLDIAFIVRDEKGHEIEYQPEEGSVDIRIEFKENQLSGDLNATSGAEVEWTHLPVSEEAKEGADTTAEVTEITADDISVEPIQAKTSVSDTDTADTTDTADFVLEHFSVVAATVRGDSNIGLKLSFVGIDGEPTAAPEMEGYLYAYISANYGQYTAIKRLDRSADGQSYEGTISSVFCRWPENKEISPVSGCAYDIRFFLSNTVYDGYGSPSAERLVSDDGVLIKGYYLDFPEDMSTVMAGHTYDAAVCKYDESIHVNVSYLDIDGSPLVVPANQNGYLYAYVQGNNGADSCVYRLQPEDGITYSAVLDGLMRKNYSELSEAAPFERNRDYTLKVFWSKKVYKSSDKPESSEYTELTDGMILDGSYLVRMQEGSSSAAGASDGSAQFSSVQVGDSRELSIRKLPEPGPENYSSILGNAVNYGIVCSRLTLNGDAQTNVAAKTAIFMNGQTGSDLINEGVRQTFVFAHVPEAFKIKGFDGYIRVPEDDVDKIIPLGSTSLTIDTNYTREQLEAEIESMLQWTEHQSTDLAGKTANAFVTYHTSAQRYDVDITDRAAGTYYVDLEGDALAALAQSGKFRIFKNDDQTIVFNIRSADTVTMREFQINGASSADYGTPNSSNKMDPKWNVPQTIVWNMPETSQADILGSVTGILLAPNGKICSWSTSSGWAIADSVSVESGEWHNVFQHVEEVEGTAVLHARKTVSGVSSKVSGFTFTLEHKQKYDKWETVSTVENVLGSITFDKLTYGAENFIDRNFVSSGMSGGNPYGVYLYRITESQGRFDSAGRSYWPDTHTYYVRIVVTKESRTIKHQQTQTYTDDTSTVYSVSNPEYFSDEACTQRLEGVSLLTFDNIPEGEKTSLTVRKVWKDGAGNAIGQDALKNLSATVVLYRGTEGSDVNRRPKPVPESEREDCQVTLSDNTGWSYTWNNLPSRNEKGENYIYYVRENEVSGFHAVYENEETFGLEHYGTRETADSELTITNYEKASYSLPATGGTGTRGIYLISLLLIALAGTGLITIRRRRERTR